MILINANLLQTTSWFLVLKLSTRQQHQSIFIRWTVSFYQECLTFERHFDIQISKLYFDELLKYLFWKSILPSLGKLLSKPGVNQPSKLLPATAYLV